MLYKVNVIKIDPKWYDEHHSSCICTIGDPAFTITSDCFWVKHSEYCKDKDEIMTLMKKEDLTEINSKVLELLYE